MRFEPLTTVACALVGAALAVVVPAWWWLRCPGLKSACD